MSDWDKYAQAYSAVYNVEYRAVEHLIKYKYLCNAGWISYIKSDNKLHAAYSVVECSTEGRLVGLSVDTLSDGIVPRATTTLAAELYPKLEALGYYGLLGFPNRKIIDLRKNYLGWQELCTYNVMLSFRKNGESPWKINRPTGVFLPSGWLRKMLNFTINNGLCSLVLKKKLHNAPSFGLGEEKVLCYKEFREDFPKFNPPNFLSISVIDVP